MLASYGVASNMCRQMFYMVQARNNFTQASTFILEIISISVWISFNLVFIIYLYIYIYIFLQMSFYFLRSIE
jgi:hypothetical protein